MGPFELTPISGPSWKHDELQRVESNCVERHARESARSVRLEADVKSIHENYISRREFEDYQELVTTRYARVVKVVDGVVWAILISVAGAGLALLIPTLKH